VKFLERVPSTVGKKNANGFVRLYIVPEMGHCGGGPVPEFGLRLQPHAGSLHSMVAALEDWVENGVAPSAIIPTKCRVNENPASGIVRTRPLYPYPTELAGPGRGSADEAANYICGVVPEVEWEGWSQVTTLQGVLGRFRRRSGLQAARRLSRLWRRRTRPGHRKLLLHNKLHNAGIWPSEHVAVTPIKHELM
jgi:hypothetical protein